MRCPYCDGPATRAISDAWYFDCANGHTFHIDDWDAELERGETV